MKSAEDRSYLQCTNCGKVFQVDRRFPEGTLYIYRYCPRCGDFEKTLWVGKDILDIYELYDPVCDERYY